VDNTHAYCKVCNAIQPMRINMPGGDDATGQYGNATDIACERCGLVITTTYRPKSIAAAALQRVMRQR
jgi:hypothetical protein